MSFVSNPSPTTSENVLALLKQYQTSTQSVGPTAPATAGVGIAADVAHAPETKKAAVLAMMASIAAYMPPASDDDADVALASATAKLKKTMNDSQASQIEIDQATKRNQAEAAKKKYDDAAKKIAEAKEKMAHASVWDKIKLAFEYIGAIASIIAGIATMAIGIATGVGAPAAIVAGVLLITSGLLMLTLAVDQTVAMATTGPDGQPGMGMFQRAFKAIAEDAGLDPNSGEGAKLVQWGSFAVSTTIMIVALVAGIAGGIIAPEAEADEVMEVADTAMNLESDASGAAGAVSDLGDVETTANDSLQAANTVQDGGGDLEEVGSASMTAANDSEDAASTGTSTAGKIGDKVQSLASRVGQKVLDKAKDQIKDPAKLAEHVQNATNTGVSAGGEVASSVYNYQASVDQSDADNLQSDAKKFEALNKALDEFIDIALGLMKKASDQLGAVLDSVVDAKNDLNKSLTNFKFSA